MGKKDKRILPGAAMITVTIFRSVVDDTKETKRFEDPVKIKDVFPGDDLSNSIISVNGFLQDSEYELADGDICAIRLFPEGNGADWMAGLGFGLLTAFAVLNFWNPGGWATAAILAGGAAAGALGFGIASAAGWSVTAWLGSLGANAQDVKSHDALEGIPQLRGARNQSNYGKPVPLVLGRHLFTPMYVGNPYSTIGGEDGEFQYFHALFMLGYGKLKVTDVKLGVIGGLASNIAPDEQAMETLNRISANGGTWTADRDGFVKCSGIGNPVFTINGITKSNALLSSVLVLPVRAGDIVKISAVSAISCYFIPQRYVEDGYLTFDGDPFLGDPKNPGDPDNPALELRQGPNPDRPDGEVGLYPQAVVEEPLNIELLHPEKAEPLNVVRFTAKNPMKVQIEIALPGGLVKYNDKGDKENASVVISLRWRVSRPDDNDPWKEFGRFGAGQSGITYSGFNTTITKNKTKAMRFVAEKSFTAYSQVSDSYDARVIELEIKRTNTQSSSPQIVDKVYLTAVRTWLFDNEKSKGGMLSPQAPVIPKLRDRTARLGFRIKATQNTQGMLDALNCMAESRCRAWNSATKKWSDSDWDIESQRFTANAETPSNNPAAVALKLLQSPSLGRKAYKDSMIDMKSFGEFYEWCAQRKYTCNGVLTSSKRLDEVLALVLSTGRAMRVLNGSRYGLLIDKPRDYPVMILNSQNVLDASNQKGFDDMPDGFLARYVNEEDGYQYTEEYVMADGKPPKPDSLIETFELPYITNRAQAIRMAWYQLACRRLRPEIWNRKVSVDGYLISIGDMVEIQDDTIAVGIGEGARITGVLFSPVPGENGRILEIQTDGEFDVSDITNKQFGIKIMRFDGVSDGTVKTIQVPVTAPGLYSNFTFNPPIELPFTPQEGDLVAFGEYSKITTPAICFGKKDNGDGTFDLTLAPYQEGIYNTDGGEIPPYEANITTPQRPFQPPYVPEYIEITNERISEVANRTDDVNNKIYRLILSIQNVILEVDSRGNILAGSLPFTVKATLYHGSIIVSVMQHYPGAGMNLFDPMVGDFVPVALGIIYSLVNPPKGVSIDEDGLITISQGAELDENNYITVQAEYRGQVYKTILYIKCLAYTPRYLGACYTPTGTRVAEVKIGGEIIQVMARQGDWVAYLGEDYGIWKNGACMRWNGTQWEYVLMEADGNFESNPYMVAMMDILEGAPTGKFLALLVGDLIAKTAMIEKLYMQQGVISGGGYIRSAETDPVTGKPLLLINKNGIEAINGKFSGKVNADSGTLDSVTIERSSILRGQIDAGALQVQPSEIKTFSAAIGEQVGDFTARIAAFMGIPYSVGNEFTVYPASGTLYYINQQLPINKIVFGYGRIIIYHLNGNMTLYNPIAYRFEFQLGSTELTLRIDPDKLPLTPALKGEVYKYKNAALGNTAFLAIKE